MIKIRITEEESEGIIMYKELKQAIINWMFENENRWQRVNACHRDFKEYIYNNEGNYLMGGETVSNFITSAEKLIYGKEERIN